jgi:DNA-binding NarL/FixJ family response regulator
MLNTSPSRPLRIILSDTSELSREGLAKLLQERSHLTVVAKCRNGQSLLENVMMAQPDLVIMKDKSSTTNLGDIIRSIIASSPHTKVAILSEHGDSDDIRSAIKAGATGYFIRADLGMDDFVSSIELLMRGLVVISDNLARKLVERPMFADIEGQVPAGGMPHRLSQREQEITALVSTGATNGEIAGKLVIQESTVKVHMRNILEKLQLRNRQQVVAYVIHNGLPHPDFISSPRHPLNNPLDNLEQMEAFIGVTPNILLPPATDPPSVIPRKIREYPS